MERISVTPRHDWKKTAEEHGFSFHTIEGEPYWDESAYYRFSLEQIEQQLERAANEVEELCFDIVEEVCAREQLMERLAIPEDFRDYVAASWRNRERNLYGRMDFCYDGKNTPKLYEYNADTPTSLYETAIFQWVWLEQAMERNLVPRGSDQFNAMHEDLVEAFGKLGVSGRLNFACARDSAEDAATIEYLEDCAKQTGLETARLFMDEIGIDADGRFTDLEERTISWLFKLYPWEWMLREEFARHVPTSGTRFIEPPWKAILSNKGLLPLLWQRHRSHPNLLPAFFADDPQARSLGNTHVRKPLFSREGWDVELTIEGVRQTGKSGSYGGEGAILQAFAPLPDFGGHYPMCGVWLVASEAAGLCIREDLGLVTTDDARFIPHVILDR
jgi:glutathionylspermidine synthase